MNLIKDKWEKGDVIEFQKYLKGFARPEKYEWTKRLINTELPCLAILSPNIKSIVKEIAKGNYLSFLDLGIWEYFENTSINGCLISKIKDFETYKKYLFPFIEKVDNWATCDLLTFSINDKNKVKFWDLAMELMKAKKPFVKRIGVDILFKMVDDDNYINLILDKMNDFENEKEYYVNMVVAWLLCDCFIKQRDITLSFFKNNKLNAFAINKAISKCRDSFRVSKEDKLLLLKYKK